MPCLPARFLFPSMMLADRFSGARLGWLPWALVAPHGSPQGRGHILSPLPACQMDGGQVFLPLPLGCLGLHCDHSHGLLWGCWGSSSSSSSFLHVCFKPWKPPGSGLALATRSQVPLAALQLGTSLLAHGSSVTSALTQGLVQFPHGCPHTPIPEPWQRISPGKGGWICLFILPGTCLCPGRGPAACPLLPCPSLSPGAGLWAVVGHCG